MSTDTLIEVIRILRPVELNIITSETKILSYDNYCPISDLFSHDGVSVIMKCGKRYEVAYTFCMKLVRLSGV